MLINSTNICYVATAFQESGDEKVLIPTSGNSTVMLRGQYKAIHLLRSNSLNRASQHPLDVAE